MMEEPKQQQQQKEKKENPKRDQNKKETPKKDGVKKEAKKGDAGKKKASEFVFPEHVTSRLQFYEQLKAQQDAQLAQQEQKEITLKLPDGKEVKAVANRTTPFEIARNISKNLAEASVIARVNGQLFDLGRVLPAESDGASIEFFTFDSEEGKKVFWHSSAHILGQAMEKRYEVCQLTVGPALSDSFYYDAATGQELVKEEHYDELKDIISDIVKQKQPFERLAIARNDALKLFSYNKYKQEIISKIPEEEKVTVYRCGPFVDLCRGPHLPDTSKAKYFHLTKNSSAYWMGKAENDSLQRLYGISFPDKKSYDAWLAFQKEAAERDHRVIGKKQELFFFHSYSPGSCFFLPHGARIYNRLVDFIRGEYKRRGFQEVVTPNIFDKTLWETSGHWQKYRDNMFTFQAEGVDFGLKPMNCPGHCLLFGHRTRSHRELPMRVADFGVLHRNELSGALTGLTRVRRFQQDDAHIFCTEDQIATEIKGCLDFMAYVYGVFGFDFQLELSTRPANFLGEVEVWNRAEAQLEEELKTFGKPWKLNPGDGAFYGPKIDIHIFDALKRSHQCATIQLDFQLPIRFGLEYQEGEGSTVKRPVIIHRAILGSVERMLANLIEFYAGKWPFWLSPRQVIVVPVAEPFFEYARQVQKRLEEENFFVDVDLSSKQFQKKISMARMSNVYYNFILVVGKEEAEAGGVNVRTRENEVLGLKTVDAVVEEFKTLRAQFK